MISPDQWMQSSSIKRERQRGKGSARECMGWEERKREQRSEWKGGVSLGDVIVRPLSTVAYTSV